MKENLLCIYFDNFIEIEFFGRKTKNEVSQFYLCYLDDIHLRYKALLTYTTKLTKFSKFLNQTLEKVTFFEKYVQYFFLVGGFFISDIHLKIPNRLRYDRKSAIFLNFRQAGRLILKIL